jgi:hypothetical protein
MEWLPIAAAAIAGVLLLQTSTPTILPAEAPRHEGNMVMVQGLVVEQASRWFTIAADGTALRAWSLEPPAVGQQVVATGQIEADPWILFVENWKTKSSEFPVLTLAAFAQEPGAYLLKNIKITGKATGYQLASDGRSIKLNEPLSGLVQVSGAIQYQPDCLCHQLVIHSWISS